MGKKRKAKHVLEAEANKRKDVSTNGGGGSKTSDNTTKPHTVQKKKRKKKKKFHVKDPQEAHSYLSLWQQNKKQNEMKGDDDALEPIWRFNKNTQSWLIRHMYDVEIIAKGTFTILVLYLEELKGSSRKRGYDDAVRRALRYKKWEKDQKEDGGKDNEDENEGNEEAISEVKQDDEDDEEEKEIDAKRWKSLNEHDKRKEYKRARKIIDVLKVDKE